ncbi:MAG: ATP phosphoribosyltransferase regulatory subunit, partial [Candidatus Krumholzibacteriota bacterium]|nr:ATP phosphoribosyltransferase regulatory subunit [Candidatus Krumholzibacteriota bacterium]
LKWFTVSQCFRYERMTRGRKREHYQWNADVIGQSRLVAEVEVLSVLILSLEKMGLSPSRVQVHLNDRRILGSVLAHLGVPAEQHVGVMVVMDKRDKLAPEALERQLAEQGLGKGQIDGLNEVRRHLVEDVRLDGQDDEI